MARIAVLEIPAAMLEPTTVSLGREQNHHTIAALSSLPNEIITRIFRASPVLSRVNLALTCKHLASFAVLPGILDLDPCAGPDSDLMLIKHDAFLPLRVDVYNGVYRNDTGAWAESGPWSHVLSFDDDREWNSGSINRYSWAWYGATKRHIERRGGRLTKGLARLILAKKHILLADYLIWLNAGKVSFLTLRYRKQAT